MSDFSFRITLLLKLCLLNEDYLNKKFKKVNYSSISSVSVMEMENVNLWKNGWEFLLEPQLINTVCDRCLKIVEKCLTKVYTNTESIVDAGVQSLHSSKISISSLCFQTLIVILVLNVVIQQCSFILIYKVLGSWGRCLMLLGYWVLDVYLISALTAQNGTQNLPLE